MSYEKSPLNWFGGKYYMLKDLLPLIESIPHKTYVSVFGGGGHDIFGKPPSPIDVYNDINSGVYNFLDTLSNPQTRDELIFQLQLTPYSREAFDWAKDWQNETDKLIKARKFYIRCIQSFGSQFANWGYAKTLSRRNMSAKVSSWLNAVDKKLPSCIDRLSQLQLENCDFREIIARYDGPETLFYLDPTYLSDRTNNSVYFHEMSYDDHVDMINLLDSVEGNILLSGYDTPLYDTISWDDKILLGKYAHRGATPNEGSNNKKLEYIWIKNNSKVLENETN